MKNELDLEKITDFLKERLKQEKPGRTAQLKMCPQPPPQLNLQPENQGDCLKAAVLLLLYPKNNRPHLVFIRRSHLVQHHQNQISFPGGQQEDDESIEQTALRETEEELGLRQAGITILGQLTPLYVSASNYLIHPVVASLRQTPHFYAQPDEVAEIIEVPLEHLLKEENLKKEIWTLRDRVALVPFYHFHDHKIWGATAMILSEFLSLLKEFISLTNN
ncbi:MAG: NUDIX hydrolase [Candidatus Saccharicenans sp.]